jgi:ferredoxin
VKIDTLRLLYFSPTQTTQKVLQNIAAGISAGAMERMDLTLPDAIPSDSTEIKDGLTLIGAPVYGGRIPPQAAERITRFKAQGSPAVLVVLYGNREFEDALVELKDLAMESGFRPIAGGAFIGEHSFADEKYPVAMNRPDDEDIRKCTAFGALIQKKIDQAASLEALSIPDFPGNHPYKDRRIFKEICPAILEEKCTLCGTCAAVCPTAAISVGNKVVTDADACIVCCACIKNCPSDARVMDHPQIGKIVQWLWENYHARKEPEWFMG